MSDEKKDSKAALGELTRDLEERTGGRITKDMVSKAYSDAQANTARLEGCKGPHRFERIEDEIPRDGYRCQFCEGVVTSIAARWYNLGLKHALSIKASFKKSPTY
jgi:hypothetical protein